MIVTELLHASRIAAATNRPSVIASKFGLSAWFTSLWLAIPTDSGGIRLIHDADSDF